MDRISDVQKYFISENGKGHLYILSTDSSVVSILPHLLYAGLSLSHERVCECDAYVILFWATGGLVMDTMTLNP